GPPGNGPRVRRAGRTDPPRKRGGPRERNPRPAHRRPHHGRPGRDGRGARRLGRRLLLPPAPRSARARARQAMNTKLVIALLLVAGSIALGVTTFRQKLTPYTSFAEARRSGTSVQVNGVLQNPKAVQYDAGKSELTFALKDDKNEVMNVVYK